MNEPAPAPATRPLATDLLVLAGFCAFLFFFGLGSFGLVGADEPRYAQIAREMLARHDWVTPVLYGKPWLEKPVLYYWQAMLSYRVLGVSDWAARVPSAVDASAMVFVIYFFMRRFRAGAEVNAALIAASSAAIIGYAHGGSTDMPLTASFTIAMLAWMTWRLHHPSTPKSGVPTAPNFATRKLWLAVFYLFIALGMLAKGPVAVVLAGLILVVFAALRREWRLIGRTLWLPGILLFLAVALPWYIAVQRSTGVFFREFFLEHNLARFGTNIYHHRQPFWYYAVVLLLSLVPWTVFAIAAFVNAVRCIRISHKVRALSLREKSATGDGNADATELDLFLLLWGGLPVIFFSFSGSKLPGYILPAVPAFAILAADYVQRKIQNGERSHRLLLLLHSAVAGALLGGALLSQYLVARTRPPAQALAVSIAVAAVVFAAMFLTLNTQGLKALRFVTLVPVIVALAFLLRISGPGLDARLSARPVAQEIARIETQKGTVAGFNIRRETEYGLAFYRDQPVPRYERAEIPPRDHLLITRAGAQNQAAAAALLPGRRMSHIGSFPAQSLELYWVSTPPPMQHGEHMDHEHMHQ